MDKLKNFKYKVIKNLLNKDELKIYSAYAKDAHNKNVQNFDHIQNNNGDTYFYKDGIFQFLLKDKLEIISKEIDCKLLPTYSFWRCYSYNAELTKHTDRPSCELSATVQIDSDGTDWPIFIDGAEIVLNNGDALIYKGCDLPHWRNFFTGDYHIQVFLHYVNANGKYKNLENDNF